MTKHEVVDLQHSLNRFTDKYLDGIEHLRVDGVKGFSTNRRIMAVKYYLGYGKDRDGDVTFYFMRRMRHPRERRIKWQGKTITIFSSQMQATAYKRRAAQRQHWARTRARARAKKAFGGGVGYFDGKPVAAWIVPILQEARRLGWDGRLVSGYRTPAYSQHLCYGICGRASCPGRCAGTTSNHTKLDNRAAIDVSYYDQFRQIMHRMGDPLRNNLPHDRVHFSKSGY